MRRERFLLGAHPIQALCEAWLIGLVVALGLSRLVGRVTPFALDNGMVMLCGLSGMWAVGADAAARGRPLPPGRV